ncbi:MAG: SUF system NifU family Fe-S cluster assembly protein [Candidatus Dojkabacteria bacterium]
MNTELFKENIIDHYKNPRNFGAVDNPTHKSEVSNVTCGDEIQLTLRVVDGKIVEIKHITRGCAICTASMSMFSEKVKGMELKKALEISSDEVLEALGINKDSGRIKCALLAHEGFACAANL